MDQLPRNEPRTEDLRQRISRALSKQDFSFVDDEDALSDLPVPTLEDVRRDVAEVPNVRRRAQGSGEEVDTMNRIVQAPPGQRLQDLLPNLYAYSTRARCNSIPCDVVGECIWALQIQLLSWPDEPPDASLGTLGHLCLRLGALYMRPDVDKPRRAAARMSELFKIIHKWYPTWELAELSPKIILRFGIALARSAMDDDKAEQVLNVFLASDDYYAVVMTSSVQAQLYLSRVLRRKGRVQEASTMERELVRWFKRNPHVFLDSELETFFRTDLAEGQTDPILTALGGPSWLEHRERTFKTEERRAKGCIHCGTRDPRVTLKSCGACQSVWYCSKTCQRENWSLHKGRCKWLSESSTRMNLAGKASQKMVEWASWDGRTNPYVAMHALGIHRDRTRGKTHVFIKELEHDPKAGEVSEMFVIRRCGVFRLKDVYGSLEKAMGIERGKGPEFFRDQLLRYESPGSAYLAPVVEVVICPRVGCTSLCRGMPSIEIDEIPYNPNWMQKVNRQGKDAPTKILQWDGAKNSEHDL